MTGTCKYCGQTMVVDYETFTGEMAEKIKAGLNADDIATMECKCEEGRVFRNIEEMKTEAKANAAALFPVCEEMPESEQIRYMSLLDLMDKIIDDVAAGIIKKCSLKLNERTTATIFITPKDGIRIKKNYKEEFVLEANRY